MIFYISKIDMEYDIKMEYVRIVVKVGQGLVLLVYFKCWNK